MQYFKNQKLQSRFPLISLMMLVLLLSSCSTTGSSKNDPLEPMNRAIFQFNEVVDDNIFEPVAKTYKYITPDPVETGVSNFCLLYTSPRPRDS